MATAKDTLQAPEQIGVQVLKDDSSDSKGFLRLRRLTLRNRYSDGSQSEEYRYDLVERDATDAVAILLERIIDGVAYLCLRSSLRPPLAFRPDYALPIAELRAMPVQWEVPAGLVEKDERGEDGLRECAARETEEEVGFKIDAAEFALVGPAVALSPGVMGEKIYFLHAKVSNDVPQVPVGDGSVVEAHAEVVFVPLREALLAVRDGRISDVKTEVAIRRLSELRGVA